jgi:hypothetical protein
MHHQHDIAQALGLGGLFEEYPSAEAKAFYSPHALASILKQERKQRQQSMVAAEARRTHRLVDDVACQIAE